MEILATKDMGACIETHKILYNEDQSSTVLSRDASISQLMDKLDQEDVAWETYDTPIEGTHGMFLFVSILDKLNHIQFASRFCPTCHVSDKALNQLQGVFGIKRRALGLRRGKGIVKLGPKNVVIVIKTIVNNIGDFINEMWNTKESTWCETCENITLPHILLQQYNAIFPTVISTLFGPRPEDVEEEEEEGEDDNEKEIDAMVKFSNFVLYLFVRIKEVLHKIPIVDIIFLAKSFWFLTRRVISPTGELFNSTNVVKMYTINKKKCLPDKGEFDKIIDTLAHDALKVNKIFLKVQYHWVRSCTSDVATYMHNYNNRREPFRKMVAEEVDSKYIHFMWDIFKGLSPDLHDEIFDVNNDKFGDFFQECIDGIKRGKTHLTKFESGLFFVMCEQWMQSFCNIPEWSKDYVFLQNNQRAAHGTWKFSNAPLLLEYTDNLWGLFHFDEKAGVMPQPTLYFGSVVEVMFMYKMLLGEKAIKTNSRKVDTSNFLAMYEESGAPEQLRNKIFVEPGYKI
jgi:hypothetical protein